MINYTEKEYPFLVNEIMQYISTVKEQDPDAALIDIIFDYSFRFNVDVELVGDAISTDVYFKSFIEKDCQMRKILQTDKDAEELGEW